MVNKNFINLIKIKLLLNYYLVLNLYINNIVHNDFKAVATDNSTIKIIDFDSNFNLKTSIKMEDIIKAKLLFFN